HFEASAPCISLVTELRPHGPLVAIDIGRRAADRRIARDAGAAAYQSPLCRVTWTRHGLGDGGICLSHAGAFSGYDGRVWRWIRSFSHRLDHLERHLSLPHDAADRSLQGLAGKHDGHHPGHAPATAADRLFLRRVL